VSPTLVLYDGVCGLCDRLVHFLLSHDAAGRFRFAALQSDLARELLPRYGIDPGALDTVCVVVGWKTPAERVLVRSSAVLHAVAELGGGWGALARAGRIVPSALADLAYGLVARIRYRVFGRLDACPIPPREFVQRFVDRSEL